MTVVDKVDSAIIDHLVKANGRANQPVKTDGLPVYTIVSKMGTFHRFGEKILYKHILMNFVIGSTAENRSFNSLRDLVAACVNSQANCFAEITQLPLLYNDEVYLTE